MILYFSATGNSKYVAERISEATGEALLDLRMTGGRTVELKSGERLGVVCPVYFWNIPPTVERALESLEVMAAPGEKPYVYTVITYGATTGVCHTSLGRLLRAKGLATSARYAVKMVDTCTFAFDVSDPAVNARKEDAAEGAIELVAARIAARKVGNFDRTAMPAIAAAPMRLYYDATRKTSGFSVESTCIHCGLCARQCPTKTIKMQDGRPTWTKERCDLCLGCLHRCPVFAIQFGKKTKAHGQYTNPNTSL